MDGAEDGTRCGSGVGSSVMGQGNCATAKVKRRQRPGFESGKFFLLCFAGKNISIEPIGYLDMPNLTVTRDVYIYICALLSSG